MSAGRNPPYGADINYAINNLPDGDAKLEIVSAAGDVIRTLEATTRSGINRVWWNLRHEDPPRAQLRVAPPGKPFVTLEDGWRPLRTWDLDLVGGQRGPRAVPGKYIVRLSIGDQTYEQALTVLKDPYSTGTVDDIRTQVATALQMRDEMTEVVEMIDDIEWLRKQLEDLQAKYEDREDAEQVVEAAKALGLKAIDVESNLFDVHLTGAREDAFRTPMKLYGRMNALASDVGANGADFVPTTQQVEVHRQFQGQLAEYRQLYLTLMNSDRPEFLRLLRELGFPDVISALPVSNEDVVTQP